MLNFLKDNFRSILLLFLAALLIFLYLWLFRTKAKDPVPTFKVTPGKIVVFPDKTLGADLVKIMAFSQQDSLIADATLDAPFDSLTISVAENVKQVKVVMDYQLDGRSIGCPPSDQTLLVIPPIGVPIVTVDVPMGRSTAGLMTNDWCNCNFNPITNCSPDNTNWRFSIGAGTGSAGKYKVEVTKNTTTGTVTSMTTSNFMLSIETPTSTTTNVRYYTDAHMGCTGITTLSTTTAPLSNDMSFSLQAFDRSVYYNTAALKYTCSVQKMIDCSNLESDRVIVVKCDDTPPPVGTTIFYIVNVRRAATPATCGDGTTL